MIWLIVFSFVLADAFGNHIRIDHGNRINHTLNAAYRVAFYVLLVWIYKMQPLEIIMFLLGAFFLAWLLFNLALNFLQHKPLDYLGKDALLDRLEAKLPFIVWLIWKIILASGFIYGYYNTQLL